MPFIGEIIASCQHCGKIATVKTFSDTPQGWTDVTIKPPLKSDTERAAILEKTQTETSVCSECTVLLNHWLTPPELGAQAQ